MISLFESLLDDFEDMEVSQDKEMIKQWCEDNLKGNYKLVVLKNGHIKLRGDVLIKDYKDDNFPYQISVMNGNLSIEKCPNITSLNGLFVDFISIDGNFSINNCEKLTSLEGGPLTVKGTLSITGNKSLKSIEGAPDLVFGNLYIMKNGKKFSVDKLKEKYKVARRIVCSIEDDEELINEEIINEALNEPHLLELVDQLKKSKKNPTDVLFRHFDIEWDLIDSSNVQEFTRIDAKAKTKIRNTIAGRDDVRGIILLWDDHKQMYTNIISDRKKILSLDNNLIYSRGSFIRSGGKWLETTTTELMNYVDNADSAIIINWTNAELDSKFRKRIDRRKSREGMVHNTPEYYEEVARENIERYKKIIAQNKAANKNKDFDQIDKDVETIVQAAFKYAQNIRKNYKPNPNNPHNHYFETSKIENIMDEIYDKKVWVGYNNKSVSHNNGYKGSEGLLSLYDQYMRSYIRSNATGDIGDLRKLETLKTLLDEKIALCKRLLGL
jgi:hypothetical protein